MPAESKPITVRHLLLLGAAALGVAIFFEFFNAFRIVGLSFLAVCALAAALRPLTRKFPRHRAISALFIGLVPTLVLLGLIAILSMTLSGPVQHEWQAWPQIQQSLNSMLARWSARLHLNEPLTVQGILLNFGNGSLLSFSDAINVATKLLTVLLFLTFGTLFMVTVPEGALLRPLLNLIPSSRRRRVECIVKHLQPQLRYWVLGVIVSMILVGLVTWVGFKLIKLTFGTPLALLAGISELVPYIGPAITFMLALLFAMNQGWGTVGEVVIVWALVHMLEAYVIWPLIIRSAVEIPPVVTMFTLVFWGEVFGIPGLLLSVPLNLLVWSILKHSFGPNTDADCATDSSS